MRYQAHQRLQVTSNDWIILTYTRLVRCFSSFTTKKSPCGSERFFTSTSDDTKHGSHKKCHAYILTCDKCIHDRKGDDKWRVSPVNVLGTTAPAVSSDWDGNSSLNIESLRKVVPREARANYNGLGNSDNANDTKKEGSIYGWTGLGSTL